MQQGSLFLRRLAAWLGISLTIAGVSLLCGPTASAQSNTGSVSGTVFDPQGSNVPDAEVTIHSTDIAAKRSVRSDRNGAFRVAGLVPGAYEVRVEAKAQGFVLKRPDR
jgi:protocatechuate 3,4-dioxygenase beta subunit